MKIDKQRLRNLTTGILHTNMDHVYEDYGNIVDWYGLMTHMLPNAYRALEPWLREKVTDPEYWDGEWRPELEGEYHIPEMTSDERTAFFDRYSQLPNPLSLIGTKNGKDT